MKRFIVRFGAMRALGVMECADSNAVGFCHGVNVVIRTSRGQEIATVLCDATKERVAKLNRDHESPNFIRRLTEEDAEKIAKIKANESADFERCLRTVRRMNVELSLVRVERLFGNERIVVYYVADGRVDFRELVRALAAEFQTRIEMKQIGVRDEMKLRDCVGDCGRELCCSSFLTSMPPVAMRMAKIQKATLDPTKVSGRCGRLKCCLRFEFETYDELLEQTPPLEAIVETPQGQGLVVAQELLAQRVVVCLENGAHASFAVEDVKILTHRRKRCDCPESRERLERDERLERREPPRGKGAKNHGARRPKRDFPNDSDPQRPR